jgi:hypothetical protein
VRDLTAGQAIGRRLARSHLLAPAPPGSLVDVVRDVGLIQAQVRTAAEIGICVRVHDATVADVRRELYERRTLVKTWSLRGTLHLVPADEAPLWAAAARGPEPYWESRDWLDSAGLTPGSAAALFEAITEAADAGPVTRAELATAVEERLGRSHHRLRSGWGELLHAPALMGTLCFGPPRGANVTFVRADRWLGGWLEVDPGEARREVLRRYLRAYGPAKADDFGRWAGFGREAVRKLFEEAAEELEPVRLAGRRAWLLDGDHADLDRDPAGVRLLPQYDAYVLGFRPRELLVPEPVKERVRADPKGRLESITALSPLLVDGVATGLWRRNASRGGPPIEVEHVVPLPRGRARALRAEVARMREILERA